MFVLLSQSTPVYLGLNPGSTSLKQWTKYLVPQFLCTEMRAGQNLPPRVTSKIQLGNTSPQGGVSDVSCCHPRHRHQPVLDLPFSPAIFQPCVTVGGTQQVHTSGHMTWCQQTPPPWLPHAMGTDARPRCRSCSAQIGAVMWQQTAAQVMVILYHMQCQHLLWAPLASYLTLIFMRKSMSICWI